MSLARSACLFACAALFVACGTGGPHANRRSFHWPNGRPNRCTQRRADRHSQRRSQRRGEP